MANNPKKYASLITLQNLVNNIKNIFVKKTDLDTTLLGYEIKGSAAAVQDNLNEVSDTLSSHTKNSDIHFTSTERTKLSGIAAGAQVNTVTGVKGDSESTYRTGNINITKANIGLGNVDNTADANKTVKHAATADSATSATKATQDASGNVIASTYETKTNAASKLTEAKTYADSAASTAANKIKNDLLNGAGGAYDTLKELGDLIDDNQDAIDALEVIASNKADKTHTHSIEDVSSLKSVLESKVDSLSDLGITVSSAEINYLDGAINNIQKQLDEKHTHWVEQGSNVILSSRSVSNNGTLSDLTSVTPPDYIVVTFDNVVYKCAMWTNNFGEKCYGDSRIAEATDMTNPENTPFYINACADDGADFNLVWHWYVLFNSNISGSSHTMKINEAEYYTLNENFIPDTIARTSAVSQVQIITWEVND